MAAVILGAKAALAVMLVVAGAAKLSDLRGFGSTVRLFLPPAVAARDWSMQVIGWVSAGLATGELALGGASLCCPAVAWLNLAVLAAACAFVAVSGVGYAFHRGRSCNCFGGLSQRRFDLAGIGRAIVIASAASLAAVGVRGTAMRLALTDRAMLLAVVALVAGVAFSAASSLAAGRLAAAGRTS